MKQREDTLTQELPGMDTAHTADTTEPHVRDSLTTKPKQFKFYIKTTAGEVIIWRGLTERQAKAMYSQTDNRLPDGVRAYGWSEQ